MLALFAIWILLSGLDDLFLDIAFLYRWFVTAIVGRRRVRAPTESEMAGASRKRIAIFVPLWHEQNVIRRMIEHNLMALRYDRCDFFVGVYPNDEATLSAVRELATRFPTVHLSECPHDGPTSKGDNLNWIFQRMLLFESERQIRFDIVVTHDAEDLIHPESLRWINHYLQRYDMAQIPVLPFPTPAGELLHGVYCDEFAEYQSKELPLRQFLGGFLPSSGTGTGVSRQALEQLSAAYANRIFEPKGLTEDYEYGFRLHRLGCRQLFVPITKRNGAIVATRGYFPRRFRQAVKQRTRWVMGIALQSWELNSWRDTAGQLYWFWRDRKGLVGNLVGPLANLVFLYGVFDWFVLGAQGAAGRLILSGSLGWITSAFEFSLVLQAVNIIMRIRFTARVYGWRFACGVPVRTILGNVINCAATACAIYRYSHSKWSGQPLGWLKTEHAYPNRAALLMDRPRLGEILVGSQYLTEADLEAALIARPPGTRLGEYLVQSGKLGEEELYECLSIQQNLAFQTLDPVKISRPVTRSLPAEISRKWRVLSYKVISGQLYLAGPEAPSEQMHEDLRRFSSLEIRFNLITPANFETLRQEFLPGTKSKTAGAV